MYIYILRCVSIKPGYYGLSADNPDGCSPCACSPGGSLSDVCDRVTGKCACRPNMVGRTCDKPADFHYCPTLDHLLYEAETAVKFDERTVDYARSITSVKARDSLPWTGRGYVRMHDGGSLEFKAKNVHHTGDYHVVVRYEIAQQARTPSSHSDALLAESGGGSSTAAASAPTPTMQLRLQIDSGSAKPATENFRIASLYVKSVRSCSPHSYNEDIVVQLPPGKHICESSTLH